MAKSFDTVSIGTPLESVMVVAKRYDELNEKGKVLIDFGKVGYLF